MKKNIMLSMAVAGAAMMCVLSVRAAEVETETVITAEEGVPGGVVTSMAEMSATVKSVNRESRELVLVMSDGEESSFVAGPEVANFDQIEEGDTLRITALESIAVSVGESGEDAAAAGAALSPLGEKPGMLIGGAVELNATIEAIDVEKREATLKFADGGTQVVSVRDDVDMNAAKVGDNVNIKIKKALAIVVE